MMSIFTKRDLKENHLNSLGKVRWSSPSNIALVKYWGKKGDQLPQNPSVSLTLENARTFMSLEWRGRSYLKNGPGLEFSFEGEKAEKFEKKMADYLTHLTQIGLDYLNYFDLKVEAKNTFAHSAGIASSASSMSALALCLCSMHKAIFETKESENDFYKNASQLARLASGSASRSVFSSAALWGQYSDEKVIGFDEFAVPVVELDDVFRDYRDAILMIDGSVKKISSRVGHSLMQGHPHASARFKRAKEQTGEILQTLRSGDLKSFAQIVEAEALELHGLMMTSRPPYLLMRPRTLEAIEQIWAFRDQSKLDLCFTLDAGANIHLLYPKSQSLEVERFIESSLKPLCEKQEVLFDCVGQGPRCEGVEFE